MYIFLKELLDLIELLIELFSILKVLKSTGKFWLHFQIKELVLKQKLKQGQ